MGKPYRPPQWSNQPFTLMLLYPGQKKVSTYSSLGVDATLPTAQTFYVFDAVMRIGHQQELTITEHPVQTGAAISEHSYIMPARVVLDVGMSDAMDSYEAGMWSGAQSKSVSAYQVILALQFARVPLALVTRLRIYPNMIIESVSPEETAKTIGGLRMRVSLKQIFMAQITTVTNPARTDTSQQTGLGTVSPSTPSNSINGTFQVHTESTLPSVQQSWIPPASPVPVVKTPGVTDWSSVPAGGLAKFFGQWR